MPKSKSQAQDRKGVKMEHEDVEEDENSLEYLSRPVKAIEEKWKLLPHFLRMRGLMRQHIDSFDHFVNIEIKKIIQARSNCEVRSEADSKFFLRYTDIYVGEPNIEEESFVTTSGMVPQFILFRFISSSSSSLVTPFQCRIRDCTYSAPLYVNVRYTRQRQIVTKNGVQIGRIPIMLRSSKCCLHGKSDDEIAAMKECIYDPGGYFVVKGVEKAMLMQEQLSKVLPSSCDIVYLYFLWFRIEQSSNWIQRITSLLPSLPPLTIVSHVVQSFSRTRRYPSLSLSLSIFLSLSLIYLLTSFSSRSST
jgi:DNA-directed RNA polymerase beta subunit